MSQLTITRLSDGKTWDANYDSMLPLWNEHSDMNQQNPEELALLYMNGWEIIGWNEEYDSFTLIFLDPTLYTVTDPSQPSREQVRKALEKLEEEILSYESDAGDPPTGLNLCVSSQDIRHTFHIFVSALDGGLVLVPRLEGNKG